MLLAGRRNDVAAYEWRLGMAILYLPLKGVYFDEIKSGEKVEEE